ncbi:uncharacterized protein [Argopecten irradians]|uniref:uncharacterized protein n=1 Tax=Argopecten irradians TaxID=31199 RepID=UPI00371CB5FE
MSRLIYFIGSTEEAIAMQVLEAIVTDSPSRATPPTGFYNLRIRTSNAGQGTRFSDASVYLRLIDDFRNAVRTHFEFGRPRCEMVFLGDILKVSVFRAFVLDGLKGLMKYTDSIQKAFLTLMEFLHEKRKHGRSIRNLMTTIPASGNKEAKTIAALALHLFSELVADKKYEVDENVKEISRVCDCGCNARICIGNTSIGSQRTWHGSVNILVDGNIAVAVKEKTNALEEDNCTDEDEPEIKHGRIDEDVLHKDVSTTNNECILLDETYMSRFIAESVTNGFAQVNMNRDTLTNFMIPTFGATSRHVSICLYDSENDYLLHIKDILELWYPDEEGPVGELNNTTIALLWIFLNFTLFTRKHVCASVDLDKSGLHEELKEQLECYRKIKTKSCISSKTNFESVWKLFEPVVKRPKGQVQE